MRAVLSILLAVVVLTQAAPAKPIRDATIAEILRGDCVHERVRVRGKVIELFADPIDSKFVHMFLASGRDTLDIAFHAESIDLRNHDRTVNAEVEVVGDCIANTAAWRKRSGPFVISASPYSILKEAPTDPFAAPPVEDLRNSATAQFPRHDRYRADGHVRATWQGGNAIVETPNGLLARVHLAGGQPPPHCGDAVRVVGRVDTDTANILLTSAIWRHEPSDGREEPAPVVLPEDSFRGDLAVSQLDNKPVTVTAVVRDVMPSPCRLTASVGDTMIQIDPGNQDGLFDGLLSGTTVRATGVFLIETETWSHRTPFPRISGLVIVLRTPDDLVILSRPSWWTAGRLAILAALLLALAAGILLWNVALHRMIDRRSRQLYREQLAHARSELHVEERTRLAVELHDSISQTLTGISFQIDSAERLSESDPAKTRSLLRIASLAIDACRKELRDCIWDLRSNALSEANLSEAIRVAVLPHVGKARLVVRFAVPRTRLSDNTAHALVRIIRELAANAVRHGRAQTVRIAGALEDGRLLFSVCDDGRGFDPACREGVASGHFGLQGVAERLRRFGGWMSIDSAPGRGTRIALEIPLPASAKATVTGKEKT